MAETLPLTAPLHLDALKIDQTCRLDLELIQGETLGLLSNNADIGQMVMDLVMGHDAPRSGRILSDGQDVTMRRTEERPFRLVSRRDALFTHLTVAGNLAIAVRAGGVTRAARRDRLTHIMALTGLEMLAQSRPEHLTAEEDLRVRLARALACTPKVLLLDNIFQGLEPQARRRQASIFNKLARALDLTTLMITTEREDALSLCDRIGILAPDGLLQLDTPERLFSRPRYPAVAVRFGDANALPGHVMRIDDDVATIRLRDGAQAEAMASPDLETDSPCILCIRPDRIAPHFGAALFDDDDADSRPLSATLQKASDRGDHLRLTLRTGDGTEIQLRRPALQARHTLKVGASVQIAWPAIDAVAFPMGDFLY